MHTGFWQGDLKGRDNLEDLGIDGRTILQKFLKTCNGSTWIGSMYEVAQCGVKWWAHMKRTMKYGVP